MTVSKRTRFEVLRRDGYKCVYCGKAGSDEGRELTIDHVVPVALGGGDEPTNLASACKDCNAGKTSIQPDSPLVQQVAMANATYGLALRNALTDIALEMMKNAEHFDYFETVWHQTCPSYKRSICGLPASAPSTVAKWVEMGVSYPIFDYAIRTAFDASHVAWQDKFRYAAGVVWNIIKEAEPKVEEQAVDSLTGDESYDAGFNDGHVYEAQRHANHDLVAHHIDGTTSLFVRAFTGPKAAV